jgi:predicted small integral membrane protein
MGIYLVRELSFGGYSLWSDPHTKLGAGILVLALLMPFLGLIHHSMYKKRAVQHGKGGPRPGRTAPGYIHIWLGRILIVLGMLNGGLGIRLASNSPLSNNPKTKIIAYGVASLVMLLLYIVFVVLGETRRTKERRQNRGVGRGVPMVAQEYQPVRAMDHDYVVPPSYEQSQGSLPMVNMKHAESTARYT